MTNNYPNLTKAGIRMATIALIAIIVAGMAGGCMTTSIQSGHEGVKFSVFGGTALDWQSSEGLNLHWPWVNIIDYDARVQEQLEPVTALSSNGLSIGMDVSIRWRPDADNIPRLHQKYGVQYYQKLVQPELRSVVREVVGEYTPEELYSSKRQELQEQVIARVKSGVETNYITIDAILIRNVELPDQIRIAIENKLKEEQEAERYQYTIAKERLEAERKQIEAEGEATYQRIITESLSSQFLRFKGIEATLKLAESPNSKVVVVGSSGDGLPLILGGQ